jgi:hypothetical protein
MQVPSKIAAGDTISWREHSLCAANGMSITPGTHNLTTSFRGPAVTGNVDIVATVDSGAWLTKLTGMETAKFNTERCNATWFWHAYAIAISDDSRTLVGRGQMIVLPNLFALTDESFDGRTQSEKDLAAVKKAISARIAGSAIESYTIGNRSLKYMAMTDLLALESRLQLKVSREKTAQAVANGLGNPRKSFIRFTR